MSLTPEDLDNISTRNELLFMKLIDAHVEHKHKPAETINEAQHSEIWKGVNDSRREVSDMKGDMKVVKFVGAAAGALLASLEGLWAIFHKGP